jgi:hypothetical protein
MTTLLVLQAAASCALAGLVWFVQLVHYPLFAFFGSPEAFRAYELEHTRRTTWVAAPLMVAEAGTAAMLLVLEPEPATIVGALLVAALWASTFLVQVPCHRALGHGWDAAVHRRLVRTNWLRTGLWTARAGLALALLV